MSHDKIDIDAADIVGEFYALDPDYIISSEDWLGEMDLVKLAIQFEREKNSKEVEELKEALKKISNQVMSMYLSKEDMAQGMRIIAIQALETKETK